MWADTGRRPGAWRPAATSAWASIWLPSTTGRRQSLRATLTQRPSPAGRTSRMSTRSSASPQVGKRLTVTSRGSSPGAPSTSSTRARSWSNAAQPRSASRPGAGSTRRRRTSAPSGDAGDAPPGDRAGRVGVGAAVVAEQVVAHVRGGEPEHGCPVGLLHPAGRGRLRHQAVAPPGPGAVGAGPPRHAGLVGPAADQRGGTGSSRDDAADLQVDDGVPVEAEVGRGSRRRAR